MRSVVGRMRMSDKLKPCPFCGGEAKLVGFVDDEEEERWSALCPQCGIGLVIEWREEKYAIEKWNRRANKEC